MGLSKSQINENYRQALSLAGKLLGKALRMRGYNDDHPMEQNENLAQSALAAETVIELITTTPFQKDLYSPALTDALDQVKREFFADVNKKRFFSIERSAYLRQTLAEPALPDPKPEQPMDLKTDLAKRLPADLAEYLNRHLLVNDFNKNGLARFADPDRRHPGSLAGIEKNLRCLQKLFPQGNFKPTPALNVGGPLSEESIIACYKNVLSGIDTGFPVGFFRFQARERAAILIRYLLDRFLESDPISILEKADSTFFIKYRLQGIYRLFNYSVNRVLYNAYPRRIKPWLRSRIENNYWTVKANRINAVRWLVEDKLELDAGNLKKQAPTRKNFTENGLSYLYTAYYNAVSKALQEAYPELEPWQLGQVPRSYWTDENAARAVRTWFGQKGWEVAQLPELYKAGFLNRQSFGAAGLATVFQAKYGRNVFRAVDAAFPGRFKPWEFGKVARRYWMQTGHVTEALRWIAEREGIAPQGIYRALRERRLLFKTLTKYTIGSALIQQSGHSMERLFLPFVNKAQKRENDELRVEKKIRRLIRIEKSPHPLIMFLFYGFYAHLVKQNSAEYLFRIGRMQKRRQRFRAAKIN